MRYQTAPELAKGYLRGAAFRLGAADPMQVRGVSHAVEESLPLPVGDPAYRSEPPLKSSFAEERAGHLDFVVAPLGPRARASERTEAATRTMAEIVGGQFGREALRWLSSRAEPFAPNHGRNIRWGAHLGTSFDRNGVRESIVTYEWGPDVMDAFPGGLYRLARAAMETLPGLRPAYSSVRCGRTSGSQQVSFVVESPLALDALRPMMDAIGLGEKHAGLMSAVAFVLGARFTLPPECCSISLRPTRSGVEMRLDIDLEMVPDLPPQLMSLLRLQLGERPQSLRALDSWLFAMTPEGFGHPGTLSVLSVCVRPDMPARMSIHLRPPVLEEPGDRDRYDRGWHDRDREHDGRDHEHHDRERGDRDGLPGEDPHRQVGTVVTDSSGLPATSSAIFAYPR